MLRSSSHQTLWLWDQRRIWKGVQQNVVIVQPLNRIQLFAIPWTEAHQASLSFTISQNLLILKSIESVMPPTISSSVTPFSCLHSFPASGSFPMSRLFPSGGQSIEAFELWCQRRLLRVPWTARRSNQSILKEISPEYSLEGLMLKLKLQYFGHVMGRTNSFEKTLMLGKIEGGRRKG